MKCGYVYILEHEQGSFYIGSTDDPKRRLGQHRRGETRTTKRLGNFQLRLIQKYNSLPEARHIERKLKNLKRRDYIEKMVRDGYIKVRV